MSKRSAILKGSSVLLLSLAYGCSNTPVNSSAISGPQLNGSGLISNNAGGLISNNAGGLISNNAGGLISNNAGGLISNNAGGLISNNAGGLAGSVKGPSAGLISNNAGGLISNNAGGLISNNAGGLISNNAGGLISNAAGGYRVLGIDGAVAVPNAKVGLFNERGEMVSYSWSVTDKSGNYSFPRVKPTGNIIFVKVVYQVGNEQVNLMSVAPAPREAGKTFQVEVNPATTLVAKKVLEMVRLRVVNVATIKPEAVQTIATKVAPLMSDKAVFLATTLASNEVAKTFDNLVTDPKAPGDLKATLAAQVPTAPALVNVTPKEQAVDPGANPSLIPTPTPTTAGGTGNQTGGTDSGAGTGDGTTTAPTPTPTPDSMTTDVSTIEGVSLTTAIGLEASGNVVYFPNNGSPSALTAISATEASVAAVNVSGAKAFAFSGGQGYVLTDTQISKVDGSGAVTLSGLSSPTDFAVVGNYAYVTSDTNNSIYKVSLSTGVATLFAGDGLNVGATDGAGTSARFHYPKGITYSSTANALFVADSGSLRIRKVDLNGVVTSFAGNDTIAAVDGQGAGASFRSPFDVTVDTAGNLYVADFGSNNIRKITSNGTVSTIAGNGALQTADGHGHDASFRQPQSIAFGKAGTNDVLYVGESGGVRVVQGW